MKFLIFFPVFMALCFAFLIFVAVIGLDPSIVVRHPAPPSGYTLYYSGNLYGYTYPNGSFVLGRYKNKRQAIYWSWKDWEERNRNSTNWIEVKESLED